MRITRSIRYRKSRKRIGTAFELQLTSMLDVMVILLVFMLKSYAASTSSFQAVAGMKMPFSHSQDVPPDSHLVTITSTELAFNHSPVSVLEGHRILSQDIGQGGVLLPALAAALEASKKDSPVLAIQADQAVPYDTLRRVMFTAVKSGFSNFHFLAQRPQE